MRVLTGVPQRGGAGGGTDFLARLLELNVELAKDEARSGLAATKKRGKKAGAKRAPKEPDTEDLFS